MKHFLLSSVILSTTLVAAPEDLNAKKADKRVVVESPSAKTSRAPKFEGLDTSFLEGAMTDDQVDTYRAAMQKLNPDHDPKKMWETLNWNIDYYNRENLPVVVGELEDKKAFSRELKGKGLRFLDLPIYMPDQGWRIPHELEQFKEVIAKAVEHERVLNPTFEKDHYVYITVDQGVVPPKKSQRRAGWHGDSYRRINTKVKDVVVPVDHLYVIFDKFPTIFMKGPFPLADIDSEDVDAVLKRFSEVAAKQKPVLYPAYTLARMDPYCVHDAGINETDKPEHRTFVKISISKVRYCHLGNARNPLFSYDWPMVPRHGVPYTKDAIAESSHRKDRDEYLPVNLSEISFMEKKSMAKWASEKIMTVYKKSPVKAEPATEGDVLESVNDGFLITVNVAEKGDYKVTFYDGDSGFMSKEKLLSIYDPIPHREGWYQPKKLLRRSAQLKKDVRFKAPWGTMMYGRVGDYLIYINENDIYMVPKQEFERRYEILD